MNRASSILALLALAVGLTTSAAADVETLHTVAELNDFVCGRPEIGARFDLRVSFLEDPNPAMNTLVVQDRTGSIAVIFSPTLHPSVGESGIIRGKVFVDRQKSIRIRADELEILGKVPPPRAADLPLSKVCADTPPMTFVRTEGEVIDIFADEIDPNVTFLLLKDGGSFLPVSFTAGEAGDLARLRDARVRVTGFLYRATFGGRKFAGPYLSAQRKTLAIVTPPPADPFASAPLEDVKYLSPEDVLRLGRRSVCGTVTATWGGNRLMVLTADGRTVNVELRAETPLPPCGTVVTAVGHPATDLFRINLTQALLRPEPTLRATPDPPPEDIRLARLLTDAAGHPLVDYRRHGRLVRLQGVVRRIPTDGSGSISLECGAFTATADVSSCPTAVKPLTPGCEVEVTGRCLVEYDNWRPDNILPRLKGISVIVRSPADVRILRAPPWWTRTRLAALAATLLAVLLGILGWNVGLRRVATRKSRELLREQISRIGSELRIGERTHLAVELHDALSQNLTGVSLQINAADRMAESDLPRARRHLDIAANSLRSCRQELRNCLWDLRNDTLGMADMNEAIRQTLAPHLGDVSLRVRFSVPRSRLTDNTTHAILRIIRELAVNAVRHGHASSVRIAGCVEDGRLMFSVADDGAGFDPSSAPGVAEGHYGLQGIRDRVASMDGEVSILSSLGKGCKATVSVKIPGSVERTA